MSIIRWILSFIVKGVDLLFRPPFKKSTAEDQALRDQQSANLSLYQFEACPFCVKVRWAMRRMGLNIELRDAKNDPQHRQDLEQGGGKIKAPCLRIDGPNNQTQWMYESKDIIGYLENKFD